MSGPVNKWIEINLNAVKNNFFEVKSRLEPGVHLMAVLKANAYGHGSLEVARTLAENGVDYFVVSFVEEALRLRESGIEQPVLVFAPELSPESIREAVENKIRLTVASAEDWQNIKAFYDIQGMKPIIHIKIDTGLGRFGFLPEEAAEWVRKIALSDIAIVEGLYTHMAEAASPNPAYTRKQFMQFMSIIEELERSGISIPLKHCANSAVLLKYPDMQLDGVRIGTLLSGQHPAGEFSDPLALQDPYAFKCRIISLRTLPRGAFLGYARTYRLKQDARIGVLPVGYDDGLGLEVGNPPSGFMDLLKKLARIILGYWNVPRFTLQAVYKGKSYPIRGKVFMQLALVEFPADLDVHAGDEVELPVRKTLVSNEIQRVYISESHAANL